MSLPAGHEVEAYYDDVIASCVYFGDGVYHCSKPNPRFTDLIYVMAYFNSHAPSHAKEVQCTRYLDKKEDGFFVIDNYCDKITQLPPGTVTVCQGEHSISFSSTIVDRVHFMNTCGMRGCARFYPDTAIDTCPVTCSIVDNNERENLMKSDWIV
jgi:hypothetical protein